jgi:hypothetical protein
VTALERRCLIHKFVRLVLAQSLLRVPPEDVFDAGPEHRTVGSLL